jgi:signal transduction histidine kinase
LRYLFILLSFCFYLFAYDENKIISNLYFSKNNVDYKVLQGENFDYKGQFFIKVELDKTKIKDDEYFLRLSHTYDVIKNLNVKALKNDNELIIKIDKNTPKDIVITFDTTSSFGNLSLGMNLYTYDDFKRSLDYEKIFFGFAYGIVFCAFLYNFALFLFNKQKSFLYYSLLQISLIFLLLSNVMTFDILKPLAKYFYLEDFFTYCAFIFAILFNKTFLNLKKYVPFLDKVLNLFLLLYVANLFLVVVFNQTIFGDYIPNTIILFLLFLSSLLVYRQGYKIAMFYILGWGIIFISVVFVETNLMNYSDEFVLHFALPLESIFLSFSLAYKMRKLEDEKTSHENMLIHQNKLASMGEMINNIAHQYRQPLTHLGYILMNIKSAFEHGELDKEYLNKKINQGNSQLLFLSKTIDSFRDFYKPNSQKEKFFLSNSIQEAISIIKPILQENKIELKVDLDDEVEVLGFENEYSQVVLNLLSNAKDALIENEIKNPIIEIFMIKKDLYIKDNAKGVPTELEEKIFQPYFSTKDKSSGIGLYMSSLIIQEHFNGKLSLENSSDSATFIIKL